MNEKYMHPADLICRVMRRLYDCKLTSLTGGNLSVMDPDGNMWVSPSGIDKGSLTRDDIVKVQPDGKCIGKWKPTSEYRIHGRIMQKHPEYRAVLHAHAPAMVTMSVLHDTGDTLLTPTVCNAVGRPALAEYAKSGSMALVDCVERAFDSAPDVSTAVLKNHAAFLASRVGLTDAFCRFELFDFNARIALHANTIGTPRALTSEQVDAYNASVTAPAPMTASAPSERELALREQLSNLSRRAYRRQLFTGSFGVISARVHDNVFLISPAEKDNCDIEPQDFVLVDGDAAERLPDATWEIHRAIYRRHPGFNSVIIAAPVYAATYAVCNQRMAVDIAPEACGVLRGCVDIPFGMLIGGKAEIAEHLHSECPFAVLNNLGILLADVNPLLAFDKLEVAEFSAMTMHQIAISKKEPHPLTAAQMAEANGH